MKTRVAYFDQMKAVAIIFVVIGHLTQFCFGMNGTDVNRFIEIFQMPVFFFVSGYFSYRQLVSNKDVLTQLWKRVRTIVFPLLAWCIIWTFTHDGETWIQMLGRCGGQYWFLYTLVIISLFFILYGHLVCNISNPWVYVICWGLPFLVLLAAKIKYDGVTIHWFPLDSIVNYYRYYLVGFLCRKYVFLYSFLFAHPVSYVFAFFALALQFVYQDCHNYILSFVGAMGGIILLQVFFARLEEDKCRSHIIRGLTFLGRKTLPIYLIHYFFIPDMKQYSDTLCSIGNPFVIHFTICLILSMVIIMASIAVERLIDINKYLAGVLLGKPVK